LITPDQLGLINDAISKWKSDDFQKVAVKTNIFKYAKAFKESLGDTKCSVTTILKSFRVTKNDLITDSPVKLDKIKKETINLRQYVIWLEKNLNEHIQNSTAKRSFYL
jgi:GTP cyclohydrolase II